MKNNNTASILKCTRVGTIPFKQNHRCACPINYPSAYSGKHILSSPYMATWSVQKFLIRAVARWGIMGKTLKVELLQNCFVIEDFRNDRTGIAIGNALRLLVLKVRRDFISDFWFKIQSVNAFTGICEFDIQKREVSRFCRFTDPDSFEKPVWRNIKNNTLKSMSRGKAISLYLFEEGKNPNIMY